MPDVCLLLENTYPYLTGGVSAWVDRLVSGLPELEFGVVHLRHGDDPPGPPSYRPPANLAALSELRLDPERDSLPAGIEAGLPEAGAYHALSTGLAGLLGARVASARDRPFLLTEHGIAWREARLGISGCNPHFQGHPASPVGGCKAGFRNAPPTCRGEDRAAAIARRAAAIERMARRAYARADAIATVCAANARLQRSQGAPPERSLVIANAADPVPGEAGEPARAERGAGDRRVATAPRIGLVGRVVPVKDLHTFLRACALVAGELPGAELAVVGPTGHDPGYADRCRELAIELGLADRLVFTGQTDPAPWYRRLDVVVLTSVSEAQPLALLEAMAAGVPVVSTAVGGCAELLLGAGADADLGPAGLLTPVADPRATARAILALCRDPGLRWRLGRAGAERARRSHSPARMLAAYRSLYEIALERRLRPGLAGVEGAPGR